MLNTCTVSVPSITPGPTTTSLFLSTVKLTNSSIPFLGTSLLVADDIASATMEGYTSSNESGVEV